MESRFRALAVAVTAAVALAGCATPTVSDDAVVEPAEPAPPANETSPAAAPAPPTEEVVPLRLNGSFSSGVAACSMHVPGYCSGASVDEDASDLVADGLNGTIVDARVTVTWNATSPAMQRLGVGVMTMWPGCEECENVVFGESEGTSPLVVEATGLSAPIAPEGLVHVYVYPASSPVYDPVWLRLTTDQDFVLEGAVKLRSG